MSGANALSKQMTDADLVAGDGLDADAVAGREVVRDLLELADEAERVAPRHVLAERHEVLLRVGADEPALSGRTAGSR